MKRRKDLEYRWILKDAFFVQAYTAKLENGKTFIVYAHNFNDMEFFLTKLEVKEAMIVWKLRKRGSKSKPFWYRGRVYEI